MSIQSQENIKQALDLIKEAKQIRVSEAKNVIGEGLTEIKENLSEAKSQIVNSGSAALNNIKDEAKKEPFKFMALAGFTGVVAGLLIAKQRRH